MAQPCDQPCSQPSEQPSEQPCSQPSRHFASSAEIVDLPGLVSQFYGSSETLAKFESVANVPAPFDKLLDHNHHMTVTVERFHHDLVDVVVHRSRSVLESGESVVHENPNVSSQERLAVAESTVSYLREITLATQAEGRVVQYGIVRLNPAVLQRDVWLEIASGEIPLGRVLIEHNVLRSVQLGKLWRVQSGPAMSNLLGTRVDETVYGRTALIKCDGKPAIELLEVVRV